MPRTRRSRRRHRMAKTGRKQKPYETSWGEIVPGLAYQRNDRRWRVIATNHRFPELASLRHLPLPRPSLKLSEVIAAYQRQNPSTPKAKQEAVAPLQRLIDHAGGAKTLDDLTTGVLLSFRQTIETSTTLKSAGTRRGYF